jgi:tripartite-type tricarboxylate transporter receptor subunit TctC
MTQRLVCLLAPRQAPPAIVKRLSEESIEVLKSPLLRERFASNGINSIGSTPEELARYMALGRLALPRCHRA